MITGNTQQIAGEPFYYLAAPFFNPEQLSLVKKVESAFDATGVHCFSPRLQHGKHPKPIKNREEARAVFQENAKAMNWCVGLVACLDYLLPFGTEMRAVREVSDNRVGDTREVVHDILPGIIRLPDTGVVFEMGHAYAQKKDIFTLATRVAAKQNIMLACSARAHFDSVEAFEKYLNDWKCGTPHAVRQWEGGLT